MSEHIAKINWILNEGADFTANDFSRGHTWKFDGGHTVPASSTPDIPGAVAENVDPEEAVVAALSGCHMLFFLSIAAKRKFTVESYEDNPVGILDKAEDGKTTYLAKITLRPKVVFAGENQPERAMLEKLHHQAHERCFIGNSLKSEVVVEIVD